MSATKLYRKLAIERCKFYAAQLCAAAYLRDGHDPEGPEMSTLCDLIASLNRDLTMLERLSE